jgi:hypothetical protein
MLAVVLSIIAAGPDRVSILHLIKKNSKIFAIELFKLTL